MRHNKEKMTETVTLELPEALAQQAKQIAALTHRRLEEILVEWIDYAISELSIESLPDNQILALCDLQMEAEQQELFSSLLAQNQEGELNEAGVNQLDTLMQVYRRGLVHKARALKVAVERGLRPPLSE
ncbi:MAG: hypothetical protein IM504_19710 [Microcystis sp. M038S2]|jgi:hypothetical protein|uniref:Uncharacterized protein n=2 Tax=Microcystis TaxID=1125 RepID=A0A552FHN0_MICAE|nr:hypothetical protein [Microcystis sp. M046S2]MCA2706967.1 hypothetical protein [Microcystis sp. M038S2]MCA2938069.1 hypothetical protein [Microcystis sp. M113S1]MCA2947139.1 hypothetical protein [Microcystis sp. M109S1]MCA2954058.1 hypothetical protein [Microcystis sp. M112S1]NCQ68165.1 hypothetical protein [Microcystis aeruginosa W13-16]NCQ72625.1 hypothetical protein [Microcystis aeruginosa W13-13]NCQ77126.1 hypothetical protein [Microcystis aeruginosa W13-15]NCQ99387.1 hypothetical pr